MFIGFGTVANVVAVILGAGLGLLVGHRLPERTRATVTDAIGLVTILIGLLSAWEVTSPALAEEVGSSAPMLIVLGSLLIGGIAGSLIDIETRLHRLGDGVRRLLQRDRARTVAKRGQGQATGHDPEHHPGRARFIEGFVSSSMLFCIGPLAVLGSLSDGLGAGADQLILKSVLDFFVAVAFAASLGVGVMASALAIAVVQGSLTLVGYLVGDLSSPAQLAALTATGGLLLFGLGLRLLNLRQLPVANLLPALVVAPLLTLVAAALV